jgi:hypothetical protein
MAKRLHSTTASKSKIIIPEPAIAGPGFIDERLRQAILAERARIDAKAAAEAKRTGRLQ